MSYTLPFKPGQSLIELGGGEHPIIRPNLDVRAGPTIDIVADLSKPLPITDAQYEGIYCKYAIEHISWRSVGGFVKEVFRILKHGGTAVFISPNTKAQMEWALQQDDEAYDKVAQCLFGDLDYAENSHKAALSPSYAMRIFREAGFSDVLIVPHGELSTDMVIEAKKSMAEITPNTWDTTTRKEAYGRDYFDGGRGKYGGYAKEGYWDYPVHWLTFQKIMELKPTSVLELGCARGYVLKKLEDVGVVVKGLEVSEHCYQTRAVEGVVTWDITQIPWPFKDKEFDLCFSAAVLEHIPEQHIAAIAQEIRRVSKRGLHGVDFGEHDDGFDKTHCNFHDKNWWWSILNFSGRASGELPPKDDQRVVDKEDLEKGPIPLPHADGKIKVNVGSFTTMFHYGWKNVDQHPLGPWAQAHGFQYQQHDVRNGMPYAGGSVDMIYACFVPGTLITTRSGMKNIEDVKAGDEVLTHKGRWRKVLATSKRHVTDTLIELHGSFSGLTATSEHPFLADRGVHSRAGYQYAGKYDWVNAGTLKKNDRIVMPIPPRKLTRQVVDLAALAVVDAQKQLLVRNVFLARRNGVTYTKISEMLGVARKTAHQWVTGAKAPRGVVLVDGNVARYAYMQIGMPSCLPITPEFARLIGYLVSDGYASPSSMGGHVGFCFGAQQKDYVLDATDLMKSIFGLTPTDTRYSSGLCRLLYSNKLLSVALTRLIHADGETRRGFKKIPDAFMSGDDACLCQLLIGLWRGDGTVGKTQASYATVNPDLAFQVHTILAYLDVAASIGTVKSVSPSTGRDCLRYVVTAHGAAFRKIAHILGLNVPQPKKAIRQRMFVSANGVESAISKTSRVPYSGFVHNFEVEEDNSYVANGVAVHNCHFLEHLTYDEGANFLKECVRVLVPGGLIRILLPDAGLLMQNYMANKMDQYNELNEGCAKTPYQAGKLWNLLFSGHSSMYDVASLSAAMAGAGLKEVAQCAFRKSRSPQMLTETVDMLPNLSLFMEAVK